MNSIRGNHVSSYNQNTLFWTSHHPVGTYKEYDIHLRLHMHRYIATTIPSRSLFLKFLPQFVGIVRVCQRLRNIADETSVQIARMVDSPIVSHPWPGVASQPPLATPI